MCSPKEGNRRFGGTYRAYLLRLRERQSKYQHEAGGKQSSNCIMSDNSTDQRCFNIELYLDFRHFENERLESDIDR
jgi:hypothetical protein